jgi:hypothetical protein
VLSPRFRGPQLLMGSLSTAKGSSLKHDTHTSPLLLFEVLQNLRYYFLEPLISCGPISLALLNRVLHTQSLREIIHRLGDSANSTRRVLESNHLHSFLQQHNTTNIPLQTDPARRPHMLRPSLKAGSSP